MMAKTHHSIFPTGVIAGGGALMLFAIVLAATARSTNSQHVSLGPTTAVATRDLAFEDRTDGGIVVRDAANGENVAIVAPQTGGFLRGIMRGLVRDHRLQGKSPHTAFRLTRWADGRLSIEDPETHESFELEAFGSTNEKVFAQFLKEPGIMGIGNGKKE